MKFSEFYAQRFIAGLEPDRLRKVLMQEDLELTATAINNGSILIKPTGKIVKCVSNYYKPVGGSVIKKKPRQNVYLNCQVTRTNLGVRCDNVECKICHRICIDSFKRGTLERIY